jgi:hypothetical protein
MSRLFAHASIDFQKYYKFKRLKPFWYNYPKGFFFGIEIHLIKQTQINNYKNLRYEHTKLLRKKVRILQIL